MEYSKWIKYWLVLGCVLLFFQIIIGGITRITGSGLSITKWEIVTGTFPPTSNKAWNKEFDLYKETPQYQKINKGMSLSDFKFIYFWEYFHRFWARIMGFVFLFPFLFFLYKKMLDPPMIKLLLAVFFSAMLAGIFGWIMVASGLKDRPWVNAYKLALHLSIALLTLAWLLWATYRAFLHGKLIQVKSVSRFTRVLFLLLCIQIFLGAILSGTRAALIYPNWPTIGNEMLPSILLSWSDWSIDNFINYDKSLFFPALIHLLHRTMGYIVFSIGIYWMVKAVKSTEQRNAQLSAWLFGFLLICQVLLGIITLLLSKGSIPVLFGVLHQAVAIFLFAVLLFNLYLRSVQSVK